MRGLRWLGSPARHYLRVGLAVSLALHAAAMLLQPPSQARPRAAAPLEVVLVNARTEAAPVQPRLLAQNAVDGGGQAERGTAASPLPRTGESAQTVVLNALRRRQMQLEAEQKLLLAQLHASRRVPAERREADPWIEQAAEPGRDDADRDSVLQNARIAALAERIQEYSRRPRRHFFAPSTSPSRYAQYVDAWRSRVEAVGTRHYPDEARGRIYGSLRMTVTLRADGTVLDVEIDQPSDRPVLNQAARRIVQLASPFAPFPPDIARETDELSITRTWHFVNDTLDTRSP